MKKTKCILLKVETVEYLDEMIADTDAGDYDDVISGLQNNNLELGKIITRHRVHEPDATWPRPEGSEISEPVPLKKSEDGKDD